MHNCWRIWCDARTEQKALKLYHCVIDAIGREATRRKIEPYPKINGYVIEFDVALASQAWNDAVVEVIELGQRFATGWQLVGSIERDPQAISNQPCVAGVVMAVWWLVRDRAQQEEEPVRHHAPNTAHHEEA